MVDDFSDDLYISDYLESLISCCENIFVIRNDTREGLTSNLIKLYPYINAEYIARIDAGDTWDKNKLDIQIGFMNSHPEVGLVGSQVRYISENKEIVGVSSFPQEFSLIKDKCSTNIGLFCHSSIVFRKNSNIFYRELYYYSQDLDLYLQFVSANIKITNIEKVLCSIIFSSQSISVKKKPLQLKCISRAIKNYELRSCGYSENNKPIFISEIDNFLWFFARNTYLKYINNSKKKIIISRIYLIITLLIYPPLLTLYLPRLRYKMIKKYKSILSL